MIGTTARARLLNSLPLHQRFNTGLYVLLPGLVWLMNDEWRWMLGKIRTWAPALEREPGWDADGSPVE